MTELCGHEFKDGIVCDRKKGHDGVHRLFEDVSTPQKPGEIPETNFTIHEWNDNGETQLPRQEQGNAFECDYGLGEEECQKIMNLAIFDARKSLEPGDVFEIRAMDYPSKKAEAAGSDYGRNKPWPIREQELSWVAWYRIPPQSQPEGGFDSFETKTEPLFEHGVFEGETQEMGGYVLVARIKA